MPAEPVRLLLRQWQALGDTVVLTAAVRDLHRSYPGRFVTDVRTACDDLLLGNPYVTRLDRHDRVVEAACPSINGSNGRPGHYVQAYGEHLGDALGLRVRPHGFGGDVYVCDAERAWPGELVGEGPYWLVNAGAKSDLTAKQWPADRWQAVVDRLRGRVRFVQVGFDGRLGGTDHAHPRLAGAVDLIGRTSVRDLVRLTFHAAGVACGVTGLMHLSAAVPAPGGGLRPCVVVAGGREPPHWEQYPGHQYLHTIGGLPCCAAGGCWRARTVPLGDGHELDASLCERPTPRAGRGAVPRCMDLITVDDVVRAVERAGG